MRHLDDAARATPGLDARFRATYQSLYSSVRRYVVRLLGGDAAHADDITQETFTKLWRETSAGREPRSERAWIFRAATNAAINASKSRRRRAELDLVVQAEFARQRTSVDVERAAVRRDIVQRALARVPDPMRQCLLLYHEGLTGKEIALVIGVAPSYVGTLVVRAHDRFRQEVAAQGGTDDLLR